jgi:hypothetical protein
MSASVRNFATETDIGAAVMAQRILAAVMLVLAVLGVADGWRLQENERGQMLFDDIGPDRYLIGLGVLLAVLALWLLIQKPRDEPSPLNAAQDTTGDELKLGDARFFGRLPAHAHAIFALIAYAAALPWLGYPGSTLLFMIVAFRIAGVADWLRSAAFGAIATALAYAIFIRASDVPLPRGWLTHFIG